MYSFKSDYLEGAHPRILERLIKTNATQQKGYGEDEYSLEAKQLLKQKLQNPDATIYFVSGGTQTNLIVISALLRVHEAVISAQTGHIYANETGAIEAVGHRIITRPSEDGKLQPVHIEQVLHEYSLRPHVVKPRMVYISNATELGSCYTKTELQQLYAYCQEQGLLLFMDGARLGNALTILDNNLKLSDLKDLCDVFYIGGTKNGALLGEAVVFNDPLLATDFDYVLKQKGALLAKGRLLGISFLELFHDDLYFSLADHANQMAAKMAATFSDLGYSFLTPSYTNQIFPVLPYAMIHQLAKHYDFYIWKEVDAGHAAIRLITSWATEESRVDKFIEEVQQCQNPSE